MKKKDVIKPKEEFNDLIKNGKFIKNNEFVIYYKENNLNKKRFGIAISTKLGKAVVRNKLKRQTREIIDKLNYFFKNNMDYIIMIRKGSLETTFHDRIKNLENILKEKL
ncbi:MAG: ribonuclease P protein component [Bacilli bacterium]|nr:ribonuclease P protein component [Bacilli bacterium]